MATPMDALAFREIFGRQMRGPNGILQAYTVTPGLPQASQREEQASIRMVRRNLQEILDHGEIFYVSSEICDVLLELVGRIDFKRIYHFEPGDFPTRIGLVYFDSTRFRMPSILARGGDQPLRALMWAQLVTPKDDDETWLVPGTYSPESIGGVVGKVVYTVGDSIKQFSDRSFERKHREKFSGPWAMRHFIPIPYDQRFDSQTMQARLARTDVDEPDDSDLTEEQQEQDLKDATASTDLAIKLMFVWTQFMQTEIVGHHKLDSQQHDRVVAREGRPPAQVRIITLRRYASAPDIQNFVEVNWTHRWKVREHYRNQRVGPGRSLIRRTLIKEHWKGPENLPQAHQDTVQALTR